MENWYGRWNATHMLHGASLDFSINEAFRNSESRCIMTWEKCGDSSFTHYIIYVAPNYKTIFFAKREKCTHRYMLEIQLIACHLNRIFYATYLICMRLWGKDYESSLFSTLYPKQVHEFGHHT